MLLWTLEDTKQNYIKIHSAQCHCCKNAEDPRSGRPRHWRGPFTSYTDALAWTKTIKRPADNCKFCKAQSVI